MAQRRAWFWALIHRIFLLLCRRHDGGEFTHHQQWCGYPQRESTSEYAPLIFFRHAAPRLYRALPAADGLLASALATAHR
jgi:hypothetical protein